MLCTNEDAKAT